jgi:hypothetical protein
MPYLTSTDITDKVAKRFIGDTNTDIQVYLDKGDSAIESIAQAKGVLDFSDIATPLVYELKEYGLAVVYSKLFADAMNVNNNEAFESDKYFAKMKHYEEQMRYYSKTLTAEMIKQKVEDLTDRHSSSFEIWR